MKTNCIITFLLCCSFNVVGQLNASFSKNEVLDDLETLQALLEEAHHNIYAYTPKETFLTTYQNIKNSIAKDSLSLLETTTYFQRLTSVVNNGHTAIDFPIRPYIEYAQAGGTIFPLEIAFEGEKSLIRKNWSNKKELTIGSEIISINGVPIIEVLAEIYPQVSAERLYFKNAKIEMYSFPRYYWQVFGEQGVFEVETRFNGEVKKHHLDAVAVIEGYETKRTEVINAEKKLDFIGNSAYLNPGGFGGDEGQYQQFIDSSFVEIKTAQSKNLIIDLRNNPGGDDSFSDYLVSYIADTSFKWNSSFTLKTSWFLKYYVRENQDTTIEFWQKILAHKDGEVYNYTFSEYKPQPREKRFNGEVYVLVNRQSHSQSTVTAAQIQDYKFGTIVGEETGEYPSLYASIFKYQLPITGIVVDVSKGYIVRVNGSEKQEGVIPDIFIKDQLLDEEDEILEVLLKRINK